MKRLIAIAIAAVLMLATAAMAGTNSEFYVADRATNIQERIGIDIWRVMINMRGGLFIMVQYVDVLPDGTDSEPKRMTVSATSTPINLANLDSILQGMGDSLDGEKAKYKAMGGAIAREAKK